jgi:LysR family transcriptional regulator, benzoate and cis,cis-muconate-responsive activator of ben and cat genes
MSESGLQRSLRHEISSIYERRGIPLSVAREVPAMHTLIGLVAAGLGVSLVPESVSAIQIADVVYLPVADDAIRFAVALAWSKTVCNPALGKFIDAVCDSCAAPRSRQRVQWSRAPSLVGLGAH